MLRFLLPLFALLLPACALAPHEYPELAPPRAVEIMPIRSDRPVVALVLGAGGARGFAHVGVIKVLEAEGIRPTVVVGSSSGSVVAALYAGGYNAAALEDLALRLEDRDVIDFTLFGPGRVEGEALQDYVNKALRNRPIEALERPFAVIATERATNRMTIFNSGNTGLAVRASSSIPNLFWPVIIAGTEYVDGGLTSRVPVPVARRMGAQVVIAVDVSWRGSRDVDAADVAIRPTTPRTRTLDFSARLESIAAGETAARAALPEIRARIAQAERGQRPRGSLAVTSLVTRDW
ncbi:MAG: patatin-like phospholipase family protein [Betaproteobacteria bacterium]|nr:patatin-like phospholipase family protein [Betaproteobacteria bacterium]